jgi:pyridoxine 4-dehydrogenase
MRRAFEEITLVTYDHYLTADRHATSLAATCRSWRPDAPARHAPHMTSGTTTAVASGTWRLGELSVHRLGFGAMRLMSKADGTPSDRDTAVAVLRRAVELGVNHIDTAAFYFSALRSANELINTALRPYPEELVLATKVGPGRDPSGDWLPPARPEQLRGQVEENLRQLGRDHMDVVNLRIGESLERGTGSLADRFGALAELREAGLVRELGISNVSVEHLEEARRIAPVVCVQNQYGLTVRREDDALVRRCAELGVAFVPFFALAGAQDVADARLDAVASAHGVTPAQDAADARLDAVASAHGVTPAQVRLAWTLHQGPNVLAIPGTARLSRGNAWRCPER